MKNIKLIIFLIAISIAVAGSASTPRFAILDAQKCTYTKNYAFLSDKQVSNIKAKFDLKVEETIVRRFSVKCPGSDKESFAFIFSDRVRTHYQSVFIWIKSKKITALSVLEFTEPKKYKAPISWLEQIKGKTAKTMFTVDALTGATLTRQSTLRLAKSALIIEDLND